MSKRILILLLIISLVVITFCTKKSTSPEEQLLPPTDLTISLVENNKIQINWIDNSTNETAYLIDRKMGAFNWLENFGEVASNITSFTDNIPTNSDTVFSYRIKAFDDENYSAYSDTIAWFSTNSAPSNLQLEQMTQDTLKLTWQDNSIGEQYFRIDRKIDEKGWQMNYAHVPADTTHFLDYTTALYDTCNYKVFAVSGISYSDSTENAFIPFLPAPSDLQMQALSATQVKLTFQDNCHNEDGYRLYARRGETAVWDLFDIQDYISPTVMIIDTNVIPGIVNYYKICAYFEDDISGFIEGNINTLPAPGNLTCTQQNVHTFQLTWQDSSQFEQGFKIDRKIDDEDWINEIGNIDPNIATWTDSTLGRNYNVVYYRIYAYYEEYNSTKIESNSNIVFPAPSNLQYEILSVNSVKLTWNDISIGEEGYKIDKKIRYENWINEYATLDENTTEWIDENINLSINRYYYRIYSFYGDCISPKSEIEISNTFNTFTTTFGGSSGDGGESVSQTLDGGFIITGWTKSYGAGSNDIWIIKTDALGNEEWNKTFGGIYTDEGYSVAQTDDEGFIITGRTSSFGAGGSDAWLIKIDELGNEKWNKTFGGSGSDYAYSVAQTSNNGFVITGFTSSFGAGDNDAWLIKTDGLGNEEWSRTFGGSSVDGGESVSQTLDGGFIIAGYTSSYGAGWNDVWLIKTDALGNEEWNKTFGGSSTDHGSSVFQTSDGGFIITGFTYSYGAGGRDVWLIKTDAIGNEEWNRTFDGISKDEGESVSQTNDGGFIIIGSTGLQEASGSDIWLIKTDALGYEEWNKTFSGSYIDYGKSVYQTNDGGFIITGSTKSLYDYDVWLIKTDDEGNVE